MLDKDKSSPSIGHGIFMGAGVPGPLRAAIDRAQAVSFDVFDTLFVRPLRDPEDLFDLLGERFGIADFRRLRQEAQRLAFEQMHRDGRAEITLEGIYACLTAPVDAKVLCEAEFALELALTRPNPRLVGAFHYARSSGRPVVITSDMYLPRQFFEALFKRHELPPVPMFISADRDATKRDKGALFDIVAAELGLPASDLLHIGDNLLSDIQRAEEKGLVAYHYRDTVAATPCLSPAPAASLASGVARVRPEAEWQPDSYHDLGYRYGGPAAYGLLEWIKREAQADGIDHILFVSRDGFVLDRLARREAPGMLPPFHYFKGSRVAFSLAATNERNFSQQIGFLLSGAEGLSPYEVFERIGVRPPSLKMMRDIGLEDGLQLGPATLPLMASALHAMRWDILKVCRQSRRGLFAQLTALQIKPGMRVAMVDVGWNGTTQDALARALEGLLEVDLFGYYFCLADTPDCRRRQQHLKMKALVSNQSVPEQTLASIYANRVAVELFFSAPHNAVIGYETGVDGQVRVIEDAGRCTVEGGNLHENTQILVESVEAFYQDFTRLCAETELIPDPLQTAAPLLSLATSIHDGARLLFTSISNFDAWGSTRNRQMLLSSYLTYG